MLTIPDIRNLAEERTRRIYREQYEHGSGQKSEMAVAPILEAYWALGSRAVIDGLRSAYATETDAIEARRLQYLLADLLEGYLENHVGGLRDALATREATETVRFDGEDIPFRQAAIRMVNEPDRGRRIALQEATCQVIAGLEALHVESLDVVRRLIVTDLGYGSYTDFYGRQRGIDFAALGTLMRAFLDRTADLYRHVMDDWTLGELGLGLAECVRHDVAFLMRARSFDHAFPESGLLPALEGTLRDLALDLRHVVLDLEPRPTKSPRAFCAPIRVPGEIYLCVSPRGGSDDYSALLHESGHSLHFAHVDEAQPYEFKYLGDNSVTETFAFTFEHFMLQPGWLERHTALDAAEIARYRYHGCRQLLFMVRRYAAKLLYELELHDERPLGDKDRLYRQHLEEALVYRHFSEYWLFDTDGGYYSAQYVRAWILSAQLRACLRRRHGEHFFMAPEAGADLVELWQLGQRLPAHELAVELGFDGLDIEPLADEIAGALGSAVPSL